MVELGKEIGFQTIAEGVEDIDLLRHVQDLGITIAQGYLINRPRPLLAPGQQWCFDAAGEQRLACNPQDVPLG